MSRQPPFAFYEFFAGGGMARAGLGADWACAFANDFDAAKAAAYRQNWGGDDLAVGDVGALTAADLPGRADLAWASSPCQDFSLAGGRAGLGGGKSSAFWGFWRLMEALDGQGRAPRLIVIENVVGLLTSHGGADFTALVAALAGRGYRVGALEIDAAAFLPQSRPRVFVVAALGAPAADRVGVSPFHTRAVREAFERLPADLKAGWVWWRTGTPARPNRDLAAVLDDDDAADWHSPDQTERLLSLMNEAHRGKLAAAAARGERVAGALFRRTRDGVQRAEVRFDGLAGCLRTPRGGSSRQTLLVIDGGQVRSRLLTAREGARLMGLPDSYQLPASQTSGLQVVGDGVAVPAVRWLAETLLEPLVYSKTASLAAE